MIYVVQTYDASGGIRDLVSFHDFYEARRWAYINLLTWHVKEVQLGISVGVLSV